MYNDPASDDETYPVCERCGDDAAEDPCFDCGASMCSHHFASHDCPVREVANEQGQ